MDSLPYEYIRWIENPEIDLDKLSGTSDMKKVKDLKDRPLLLFVNEWSIRMTQELQCQMLSQVADLFTAMHNNASKAEQTELLAKLEISLRLLAGRLGISQDGLSRKAAMTLKAALVQEDVSAWKSDLLTVLHELEET